MAITKRTNKTGSVWSVDIYLPDGKRFRRTVGTRKEAEAVEAKIRTAITAGEWKLKHKQEIRFREMVNRYLEYALINKARSTYIGDKYRIEANLVPYFGDMLLSAISPPIVEDYKAMRCKDGVSLNTINHELINLSSILTQAIKAGYLEYNIMSQVEKFKLSTQNPRFLSLDEIDMLVEAAHKTYIYPLLVCALHTGMRKSELFNLQWGDIDFQQETITIQSKDDWHTKNYKARTIQMTPMLKSVLLSLESRSVYVFENADGDKIRYIDRTFKNILKRAGLKDVTLHTLRHTFASQLVMAGVPLRDVQELMGHRSYETTLKYAHLSKEHVKRQVMRLPYGEPKEKIKILRIS